MKVKSTINNKVLRRLNVDMCKALVETADAVKSDLVQSQTMPFGESGKPKGYLGGNLQNRSTFVDDSDLKKDVVYIVSDTPYARRLYFHPEYNFYKGANPNAGGLWFEPYITGRKKEFVSKTFAKLLKKRMK